MEIARLCVGNGSLRNEMFSSGVESHKFVVSATDESSIVRLPYSVSKCNLWL